MSDWQAGDDGICIKLGPWTYTESGAEANGPTCGQKVKVRRVEWCQGHQVEVLWLEGWPGDDDHDSFFASNFVKITPGHTVEGSEVDQREPWKVGV